MRDLHIHPSAVGPLGLPTRAGPEGAASAFTADPGPWRTRRHAPTLLRGASYYYRDSDRPGRGVDVFAPHLGRAPFAGCSSPEELAAQVALFRRATGLRWRGSGAATFAAWLRANVDDLAPTLPTVPGSIEAPDVWPTRSTEVDPGGFRYCHALDRTASYLATWTSLPLPVGEGRVVDWPTPDQKVAGLYEIEEGGEARWVTAPTFHYLAARGPVVALQGVEWPETSRTRLRPLYGILRRALDELRPFGPVPWNAALAAAKDVYKEGTGWLAHEGNPETDKTVQTYWRAATIAAARVNLRRRLDDLDVPPIAVDRDCAYFLSSRPHPGALAIALGLPFDGRLGSFHSAGTIPARRAVEVMAQGFTDRHGRRYGGGVPGLAAVMREEGQG